MKVKTSTKSGLCFLGPQPEPPDLTVIPKRGSLRGVRALRG